MPAADIAWPTEADLQRWEQYPALRPTEDEIDHAARAAEVAAIGVDTIDAVAAELVRMPDHPYLTYDEVRVVIAAVRRAA